MGTHPNIKELYKSTDYWGWVDGLSPDVPFTFDSPNRYATIKEV